MPLHDLIDHFPSVQHAFAYGSGVFKQPGLYSDDTKQHEGPMVDLIFAVDDPIAWHNEVKGTSGGKATAIS
jgi:mitochondrial translocator assembly and maintenance protein 41